MENMIYIRRGQRVQMRKEISLICWDGCGQIKI